ncbi:hypothetical protein [Leptolyngbya sp. KIOST-1]|uniref:hypothetical protein n=1 Tax=Leptolyngbya sp. KIOST-1 TaxID=1229172 RepID=UPI0012E08D3E|nr:hypothetical protein [Leptolyngbya sp. KIOST-1]
MAAASSSPPWQNDRPAKLSPFQFPQFGIALERNALGRKRDRKHPGPGAMWQN